MNSVTRILVFTLAPVLIIIVSVAGCRKDLEKPAYVTVRMTDQPANFSQVNVDVQRVEVHYNKRAVGKDGWQTLKTKSGNYDLLTLRDNVFAVLVDKDVVPPGSINQMRLILGANNSVITATGAFPLVVPGSMNTGIKINAGNEFKSNKTTIIILDFDAEASLKYNDKGFYELSPVIKVASVTEM